MTRSRVILHLAGPAVVVLTALGAAGCGSTGSSASPATHKSRPPQIGVSANKKVGSFLVDSKGRTLYLFETDKGTRTTCFDACAKAWPPVRANAKPATRGGARARKVGTAPRPDGARQATYNGHPLYLYEGDETPGKVNGQGVKAFGARWYVLSPAGKQITKGSPPGGSTGY
jgi:predicted lipoprotein with Yx(FWY)xxD motif